MFETWCQESVILYYPWDLATLTRNKELAPLVRLWQCYIVRECVCVAL